MVSVTSFKSVSGVSALRILSFYNVRQCCLLHYIITENSILYSANLSSDRRCLTVQNCSAYLTRYGFGLAALLLLLPVVFSIAVVVLRLLCDTQQNC